MKKIISKAVMHGFAPAIAIGFLAPIPTFAQEAVAQDAKAYTAQSAAAYADIRGCEEPHIIGRVTLVERPSAEGVKLVDVQLVASGLTDGKHAVHIHETGSCSPCTAAGGHFDPGPASNSSPDGNHPYHSGDLINIDVKDGIGAMSTTTNRVTLSRGPLSVFDADGSAFIIHVNPDTYCPKGETAGCAGGARVACGVIKRM